MHGPNFVYYWWCTGLLAIATPPDRYAASTAEPLSTPTIAQNAGLGS
jgi:hypothetical protein